MKIKKMMENAVDAASILPDALEVKNPNVLLSLLGPAFRGLILEKGKNEDSTLMLANYNVIFDWTYDREFPAMSKLYELAKKSQ